MRAVAIAGVSAVLMTMIASLTLLPAFLGFVGKNIDRFKVPLISRSIKEKSAPSGIAGAGSFRPAHGSR